MLTAVCFYCDFVFRCIEIKNIVADRELSPELYAIELTVTKN